MQKLTPVQRLTAAMERCARTRGEALWVNGRRSNPLDDTKEAYDKEQRLWRLNGDAEARFRRLAQRIIRECKAK